MADLKLDDKDLQFTFKDHTTIKTMLTIIGNQLANIAKIQNELVKGIEKLNKSLTPRNLQ